MPPESPAKRLITLSSQDSITLLFTALDVVGFVLYYVVTKEWQHTSLLGFYIVLGLMLGILTLLRLPATKEIRFLRSDNVGTLTVYALALAIAYLWYVSIYSPFIIPVAGIMFLALYFRGVVAYFVTIGSLIAFIALNTLKNGLPHVPYSYLYPIVTVIFGAAYGGAISRAGALDRRVRQEFDRISQHTSDERQQLTTLINSMRDAVIAVDPDGRILFFNPAALGLLNVHAITIGGEFNDLVSLYDKPEHRVDLLSLTQAQRGYILTNALYFIPRDNEKIDLSIDISPIHASVGGSKDQGYIMVLRDITKEKTLDDQRNEFISVTSHELRTPLAIAEASISLAMNPKTTGNLDEATQQRLKQAHDNILFLSELVNVLTTLEMAERESLSIDVGLVNASAILQELVDDYHDDAVKKGLSLTIGPIEEGLPKLRTSPIFLREILQNLITNAIKYTNTGSITLLAKKSDNDHIIFSVQDTGIGISTSDKKRVFEKYYRSEDYRTQDTSGTGLGLYLVRRLTDYLHGTVSLTSELGKGSTFYVELPLVIKEPMVQATTSPSAL